MKAYIHRCNADGTDKGLGTFNNWITGEYKNLENLIRFGLKDAKPGLYRIEAFYDWDDRYGECDINTTIRIH